MSSFGTGCRSVIRHFFGDDWAYRQGLTGGPKGDLAWPIDDADLGAHFLIRSRIEMLAKRLADLQSVAGFPAMVRSLRTRSIDHAMAELRAVVLLREAGHSVGFVEPSSTAQADYDAEVLYQGRVIPVEVKALEPRSVVVDKAAVITKKLKKASSQLPRDSAGVVFLRLPGEWASTDYARESAGRAVQSWLSTSGRVNAVVLLADFLVPRPPEGAAFLEWNVILPNPTPRVVVRNICRLTGSE